jgi:membrane-associated phospholipid phosphatase
MTLFRTLLEWDARGSNALCVAEKPGPLRTLAAIFAHSGDSWFWALGMALLWLFAPLWKQWAVFQFWWISVLAFLVIVLKFIIRRRRPEGEWGAIYRNTDPHSFPSGHAARAFLIAMLASLLGPDWLAAVLWVWAPLVSLARVAMGVHYISDIIAGAILGIIIALLGFPLTESLVLPLAALVGLGLW